MTHVPANEKAGSLNVHRYSAVQREGFAAAYSDAHAHKVGRRTLNSTDPPTPRLIG